MPFIAFQDPAFGNVPKGESLARLDTLASRCFKV
jgi:hypothetical protein